MSNQNHTTPRTPAQSGIRFARPDAADEMYDLAEQAVDLIEIAETARLLAELDAARATCQHLAGEVER